jgi:hypothetical protein
MEIPTTLLQWISILADLITVFGPLCAVLWAVLRHAYRATDQLRAGLGRRLRRVWYGGRGSLFLIQHGSVLRLRPNTLREDVAEAYNACLIG